MQREQRIQLFLGEGRTRENDRAEAGAHAADGKGELGFGVARRCHDMRMRNAFAFQEVARNLAIEVVHAAQDERAVPESRIVALLEFARPFIGFIAVERGEQIA